MFLVGAGPGDPGLLTLRAAEVLESAEVLLYDALASDAIVALAPATCERIYVGKRAGDHAMPQDEIERLAIERARAGSRVVRLKGGDPFIFGRGGEEAQALAAAGVAVRDRSGREFGVRGAGLRGNSGNASRVCRVVHRRHRTRRSEQSRFELDWAKLADPQRTLVLLMATANLREIAKRADRAWIGAADAGGRRAGRDAPEPANRARPARLDRRRRRGGKDRRSGRRGRRRRCGAEDAVALVRHRRALRQARLDHASRRTVG